MPMFVIISEGPRADRARPIMAVSDQTIIAALLTAIGRKATVSGAVDGAEPERGASLHLLGAGSTGVGDEG